MGAILLRLRFIHLAFLSTWISYVFLIFYLHPPEKPLPNLVPIVLGTVAVSSIAVGLSFRRRLLHAAASRLVTQPEDKILLARWRAGNIVSFVFAESIMLWGALLKFLGAHWSVAGIFFAGGLVLLLLWTPRAILSNS